MDKIVFDFLANNGVTMLAVYSVLYGFARYSPWTWDEKVMEVVGGALEFFQFKRGESQSKPLEIEAPK